MLVQDNQQSTSPKYAVSLYLATAGIGGHLMGSDEKEIIYLVFGIVDLQNKEIIGIKQYFVRPVGLQYSKNSSTPNTSATSSESGSIPSTSYTEPLIPEAILQSAGKPLSDVINEFDSYLRSLKIDQNNICLVTDGQLPMRQCLHPEAVTKDMHLPSYYWKFSDLKKDYAQSKSQKLLHTPNSSNAANDISKLPNPQPASQPAPIALAEMLNELELQSYMESDFYVKESRDMITIVQSMIIAGHYFDNNDVIIHTLEPGICSIDDEIDGNCIVRARGLPWQSSDQDIAKFFRGLNVAKGGVALCLSPQGRRNGEALIRFISKEHRDMALKRHKHHIGSRYIEVYPASGEDFLAVAGGASNEARTFLSKGTQVIIRMRGLPYDCTAQQVLDFFASGENSCKVLDDAEGILFVKKPDGRSTGDAFVLFADESDAPKALSKHRESIGQRYIELFRTTISEVQQVLNRSMDPKTYEQNTSKPPLIAQIPTPISQIPLLPQHVITSGTEKNCIRLRGLPYEAKVEHILHFLEDFAKHIVYQGVHLVYNAQGQFNGEAFIQMDSESAAAASAQQKHHKHMMFGKKQRYIEVFQCSGEDMNMVLNGGGFQYQSQGPAIASKTIASSGNTLIAPQQTQFAPPPPYNQMIQPPTPPGQSLFPPHPQIFYWGYPSGPISPTYFGPLQIPPHPFPHFAPDRPPALLAVGDEQSQIVDESTVDMQSVAKSPEIQFNNNNNNMINNNTGAIPNHLKLTANFNFHVDEQGNIGRVDVSKAFCYQTQDMSNNVLAKNVVVMKKPPIMMTSSPNGETHFVDCNNNLNGPTIIETGHMPHTQPPPPSIFSQKHFPPPSTHPMSPLNINIHPPQFVNHLNWNHAAQYQ